jgi:hypothetical protein
LSFLDFGVPRNAKAAAIFSGLRRRLVPTMSETMFDVACAVENNDAAYKTAAHFCFNGRNPCLNCGGGLNPAPKFRVPIHPKALNTANSDVRFPAVPRHHSYFFCRTRRRQDNKYG